MDLERSRLLRQLPSVDELLRVPDLIPAVALLSRPQAAEVIRRLLAELRERLRVLPLEDLPPKLDLVALETDAARALTLARRPSITRVINASGVVIHTNLGRSPLAVEAQEHIHAAAACYTNLEYDLEEGKRGSRHAHLEKLLPELTGAEACLVVNNNAAAVFLALNALAAGREVIISRGQLVEIGGSFRMPDIMAASGGHLREVGTTNKTYLKDFEQAITSETAILLKVHPSNYRIMGFTHEVTLGEMVELGGRYGLKVVEDLGSGCLVDLSKYGLEKEPTVQETLKAGADLVMFSGDKLLGGPQAGVILGNREVVGDLRKNPLTRALRPDKMTLTALEATLRLYLDEPRALMEIPTLRMLTRPVAELDRQARALARRVRRRFGARLQVEVVESEARAGGGTLPQAPLPSRALAITIPPLAPQELEVRLHRAATPVIGRVERGVVILDLLTALPGDQEALMAALAEVLAEGDPLI